MIAMVLLFTLVCFIAAYIVTLCDVSLGLQLKNIRLQPRPRPDLQSKVRPNPAPAGFEKIKSGATLTMTDANDAFTVAERYRPTAINNVQSKSITAVVYFNSQCASTVPSALAKLLVTSCCRIILIAQSWTHWCVASYSVLQ